MPQASTDLRLGPAVHGHVFTRARAENPPGCQFICRKKLNFANEGAVMPSNIFVPIVDLWSLYDNRTGIKAIVNNSVVVNRNLLNQIKESCLKRKE